MKDTLRQQFERLAMRLGELDATLADPSIASDMNRFRSLTREHAEVGSLVQRFRHYEQRERDLASAREMLVSTPRRSAPRIAGRSCPSPRDWGCASWA